MFACNFGLHQVYTLCVCTACKPSENLVLEHPTTPNFEMTIFQQPIDYPFELSQRTDLTTFSDQQIVLVCGAFDPYATI